jgi:hypothetical protein
MTHHTHLVERRLPIEQNEAMAHINDEQTKQKSSTLTLHPSNGARQSSRIEGKRLLVCCSEDQFALRYLAPHILLLGTMSVHSAPALANMRY